MQNQQNTFLTNNEAAEYLRVCTVTLWRLKSAGEIPFARIGGKLLYRRADLDAYVEQKLRNLNTQGNDER